MDRLSGVTGARSGGADPASISARISTRQVERVVTPLSEETVSAQTVSKSKRVLHQAVAAFHRRPLGHNWAYLVLDGVWLKVRRAFGPQRVLLLAAYGKPKRMGRVAE